MRKLVAWMGVELTERWLIGQWLEGVETWLFTLLLLVLAVLFENSTEMYCYDPECAVFTICLTKSLVRNC